MSLKNYMSASDFVVEMNKHLKLQQLSEIDVYDFWSSNEDAGFYRMDPYMERENLESDIEYYDNSPTEKAEWLDRIQALHAVIDDWVPLQNHLEVR